MAAREFLAVDWGTTNRRVYHVGADGSVLATARDDRGVLTTPAGGFAAEAQAIRDRFGDLPLVCAGMVGSQRGWTFVPYLPCPVGAADLGEALHEVEPGRTYIVYGVSDPRGDVMRGEEVQLLGAVASGMVPDDAILCQPGTHCKWATVEHGRIQRFTTAMTGEMFAMLKRDSLLSEYLVGAVEDNAAFRDGVLAARDAALLDALFSVRARAVLGMRPVEQCAAFTSGLLIGSDVGARGIAGGGVIHLLADPTLGALYASAIRLAGAEAVLVDSHRAFVAGITQIWNQHHATP